MKARPLLLSASLVANLLLAALLFWGKPAWFSAAANAQSAAPPDSKKASNPGSRGQISAPAESAWARLPVDDLPAFVTALRAEGFPTSLVWILARDRIRLQFAPRRAALLAQIPERPFWEPEAAADPQILAQQNQITKEENEAMKALSVMGDAERETARKAGATERMHLDHPNLSDEKIAGILQIQETFNGQRTGLRGPDGLPLGPAEGEKLLHLDQAQQEAMAQMLKPDELQEYNLHSTGAARTLSVQLAAFDPTKEEFLALYAIKQSYRERLYPSEPTGKSADEDEQAHAELLRQQDAEIRAAVGDTRFAEYQRAIDWSYLQTSQLVSRLALPREAANQVYAVQQEIQARAQAVQSNRELSSAERAAQLAALSIEAQAKVTAALGEAGFQAYPRYGGDWMQALTPSSAATQPGETIVTRTR